jgi:drug/metabolite transporter (DMT)-like permease
MGRVGYASTPRPEQLTVSSERKPVDGLAFGLMALLCALWGFQQVTIKLAAADVSPLMQAGLRSILATVLLLAWARWRRIPLFDRDGTLPAGLAAGALFAAEFGFIYGGLSHTTASRMVVFLYLAPCLTALMLPWFVPSERLTRVQWTGVLLGFAGVAFAFRDGLAGGGAATLRGDASGALAAFLWASTTVLLRATRLAQAKAEKTLLYQLAVAAIALTAMSPLLGEPGVVRLSALAVAVLAYQGAIVAFASFLAWFWLLTRYRAAQLSVFSFLTPLFGVAMGMLMLGDPISPAFLVAALLVGVGIALVSAGAGRRR